MDAARQKRLNEVARIAVQIEAETQLPAQLLVAQWAVESKWGARPSGNANYFGIKFNDDRHKKFCLVTTREVFTPRQLSAWRQSHPGLEAKVTKEHDDGRAEVMLDDAFADYDSLEESCRDYAALITQGKPYREAWQQYLTDRSLQNLTLNIARVYATGIRYAELVSQIAAQSNVKDAIARARKYTITPIWPQSC